MKILQSSETTARLVPALIFCFIRGLLCFPGMAWVQEDKLDTNNDVIDKPVDVHFYGALGVFLCWYIYVAEQRRHDYRDDKESTQSYKEGRALQNIFCSYIFLNYIIGLPVLAVGWFMPGEGITFITEGLRTVFASLIAIMFMLDCILVFKKADWRNMFSCCPAPVDDDFIRANADPIDDPESANATNGTAALAGQSSIPSTKNPYAQGQTSTNGGSVTPSFGIQTSQNTVGGQVTFQNAQSHNVASTAGGFQGQTSTGSGAGHGQGGQPG